MEHSWLQIPWNNLRENLVTKRLLTRSFFNSLWLPNAVLCLKVHNFFSWSHYLADTQKACSEQGSCKEEPFEEESNTPMLLFVIILLFHWFMGGCFDSSYFIIFQVIYIPFYCSRYVQLHCLSINLIYKAQMIFEVSTFV